MLPETTADLPAVSGILTRGEGSSLSHVQLLARNLGIPNVVVGEEHMPVVNKHLGDQVVLAVSPGGIVNLDQTGDPSGRNTSAPGAKRRTPKASSSGPTSKSSTSRSTAW